MLSCACLLIYRFLSALSQELRHSRESIFRVINSISVLSRCLLGCQITLYVVTAFSALSDTKMLSCRVSCCVVKLLAELADDFISYRDWKGTSFIQVPKNGVPKHYISGAFPPPELFVKSPQRSFTLSSPSGVIQSKVRRLFLFVCFCLLPCVCVRGGAFYSYRQPVALIGGTFVAYNNSSSRFKHQVLFRFELFAGVIVLKAKSGFFVCS